MVWQTALPALLIAVVSGTACRSQDNSLLSTPFAHCAGLYFWLETSLDTKKQDSADTKKIVLGYMEKRRHLKTLSERYETDPDLPSAERAEVVLEHMVNSEREMAARWLSGCKDNYSCAISASLLVGDLQSCEDYLRKSGY